MKTTAVGMLVLALSVGLLVQAWSQKTDSRFQGLLVSTPAAEGMDPAVIQQLLEYMDSENIRLQGLMILRHDKVIFHTSWYPFRDSDPHRVYSVTKSVISALIGVALDQGKLRSVNQTLGDFFPDNPSIQGDPAKAAITIRDLLMMNSGFEWPELIPPGDAWRRLQEQSQWVDYLLARRLTSSQYWNYDSGDSHLLSAILTKATGMSTDEYAKQVLFRPLGITDERWYADPQGISNGGNGLVLSLADMAKIGVLFLHQGVWNGKSLVSGSWVQASTSQQIDRRDLTDRATNYGYHWWTNDFGGYSARGSGGQCVFVVPNDDLVIVCIAGNPWSETSGFLETMAGFLVPLPTDFDPTKDYREAQALLDQVAQAAASPPPPVPVMEMTGSDRWLGKRWRMDDGSVFQVDRVSASELRVLLIDKGKSYKNTIGLDGRYRLEPLSENWDNTTFMYGNWIDASTLEIHETNIITGQEWLETFQFSGDTVHEYERSLFYRTSSESNGRLESEDSQ